MESLFFKMAANPITTDGCLALAEALKKSQVSNLNYLDLLVCFRFFSNFYMCIHVSASICLHSLVLT